MADLPPNDQISGTQVEPKDPNKSAETDNDPKQPWVTEEERTEALIKWSNTVKESKGDFPKARLTPDFLKFVRSSNFQMLHKELDQSTIAEVPSQLVGRLDGSASIEPNDSFASTSSEVTASTSAMGPKNALAAAYQKTLDMERMIPAKEALKHHVFATERRKAANCVKLGQKLGMVNPLAPLDPEKVMPFQNWPSWDDEDVQEDVKDWQYDGSDLLYQAILFKNQSDLTQLRDNRELLNDEKFYLLKPCSKDMAL